MGQQSSSARNLFVCLFVFCFVFFFSGEGQMILGCSTKSRAQLSEEKIVKSRF